MRLALAAALLVAAPLAAAGFTSEGSQIRFESPAKVVYSAHLVFTEADAQEMREAADIAGDQDGKVSSAEADEFVAMVEEESVKAEKDDPTTVDGKEPKTVTTASKSVTGITGDVDSGADIAMTIAMTATYDVKAGSKHTVVSPAGQDEEGSDHRADMLLVAPPGYIITSYTGFTSEASLSKDETKLTFIDGANSAKQTVVFGRKSDGDGAASAVGPVLGLLLAALACIERRRSP